MASNDIPGASNRQNSHEPRFDVSVVRKDFPISGHVEMRYDEIKKRVVYEPVTIEPRVTVPRVIRDEGHSGRDS